MLHKRHLVYLVLVLIELPLITMLVAGFGSGAMETAATYLLGVFLVLGVVLYIVEAVLLANYASAWDQGSPAARGGFMLLYVMSPTPDGDAQAVAGKRAARASMALSLVAAIGLLAVG